VLACDWPIAGTAVPSVITSASINAQSEWNGLGFDIFLPL
jgi:hypothetical protein